MMLLDDGAPDNGHLRRACMFSRVVGLFRAPGQEVDIDPVFCPLLPKGPMNRVCVNPNHPKPGEIKLETVEDPALHWQLLPFDSEISQGKARVILLVAGVLVSLAGALPKGTRAIPGRAGIF